MHVCLPLGSWQNGLPTPAQVSAPAAQVPCSVTHLPFAQFWPDLQSAAFLHFFFGILRRDLACVSAAWLKPSAASAPAARPSAARRERTGENVRTAASNRSASMTHS